MPGTWYQIGEVVRSASMLESASPAAFKQIHLDASRALALDGCAHPYTSATAPGFNKIRIGQVFFLHSLVKCALLTDNAGNVDVTSGKPW